MDLKPTLKCPGGKTKLLPELTKYLPLDLKDKEYRYLEPFIGGGSVLFHLVKNQYVKPENCYINDYNPDIINLYNCIKSNPKILSQLCDDYSSDMTSIKFNELKRKFNSSLVHYTAMDRASSSIPFERAALFLVLNKNCFNGLIRYNKKGEFNSPYGKYKNPSIYDPQNLLNLSDLFNTMPRLHAEDFETFVTTHIFPDTFVYLDPPYLPISLTSSFSSYTSSGFSIYDHIRLRNIVDLLNKYNAKFLLSNSNCVLTKEIFKGYNIKVIKNKRSISAKSKSRGIIKEMLISNY